MRRLRGRKGRKCSEDRFVFPSLFPPFYALSVLLTHPFSSRQLLYLTHSTRQSETRVRTLLTTLQTARSSLVSRAALQQLHTLSLRYTSRLDTLTLDRSRLTVELDEKERERAKAEEKVGECVLDLVLEWDDQRRWRKEEKLRRKKEGRGFGFSELLRELEGVAMVFPRLPSSA
jgi:hypothetical protein